MPEDNLQLSEEDKKAIREWINTKWPLERQICDVCGSHDLKIASHLVTPNAVQTTGAIALGGTMFPQAMVICLNCGQTKYFNAVLMGIQKREAKKDGD